MSPLPSGPPSNSDGQPVSRLRNVITRSGLVLAKQNRMAHAWSIPTHSRASSGWGESADARQEPGVAVRLLGGEQFAVRAYAAQIEHDALLLPGDVGAGDPRRDLREERLIRDVQARLGPGGLRLRLDVHPAAAGG